VAPQ
jgi:hypothetical protein